MGRHTIKINLNQNEEAISKAELVWCGLVWFGFMAYQPL